MKIILALILISNSVAAGNYRCFPESDVEFPVRTQKSLFGNKEIDETMALRILKTFESHWEDYFETKLNKKITLKLEWGNSKVNAYATRDMEDNLEIIMTGGMVRHPAQSPEGVYLVLCHELGHFLGGAPKSFRGRSKMRSWSSAEGQADYFATNKCMIKLFDNGVFSKTYQTLNPECNDNFCHLVTKAGLDLGKVFASLRQGWKVPKVGSKVKMKVRKTEFGHPNPQCRFETFLAGEKCREQFYKEFDDKDYKVGACFSGFIPTAARPTCWFSENDN